VREVAEQARCSEARIQELLRGGVIPGERIGGWWFVRAKTVRVLLQQGPPWPSRGAVADAVRLGVDPATLLEVSPDVWRRGVGYVGAAEAARRLRVPYKAVLKRIAAGELEARRVHGSWAVAEDALALIPRRMTIHEVADRLGVERQRVHQLIREGRLAAHREGRLWLVEEGALEGLLGEVRGPGRGYSREGESSKWGRWSIPAGMVTTAEAAAQLGLSRSSVWRLAKSGEIRAQRVGQLWLIRERDLAEVLGARSVGWKR
jgi:excisionase family DNA binding protein